MSVGLTAGGDSLRQAAITFFKATFANPTIVQDKVRERDVEWLPSMIVTAGSHRRIAVEVSDKPYPRILELRRAQLNELNKPVEVLCVCTAESYANGQSEAKRLLEHGYGLITVSQEGDCHLVRRGEILFCRIPEGEFKEKSQPLTPVFKRRVREAFETYKQNPVKGLADLCEVLEGMTAKAGKEAAKKGYISRSALRGPVAGLLDAMTAAEELKASSAAFGAVRGYLSEA